MKKSLAAMSAVAVMAVTTSAFAGGISQYESSNSEIITVTNFADFNAMQDGQSLFNYQEDGLRISVNDTYFDWNPPGFDGTNMYYANGGVAELIDITKVDGSDFDSLDMQFSNGWANATDTFMWIQVYNNGGLVAEFDVDGSTGNYVGLTGGGFDQVLIGSYFDAGLRDAHDTNQNNAIALDNMRAGVIPAPGVLALLGIAGLGIRRRRRG